MRREIKFRYYYHGKMVVIDVYNDNNRIVWGDYETIKCSPLMQCTGLKDKNGKDIYEGDIYRDEFSIDDLNGLDERIYFICVFLQEISSFVWMTIDEYNLGSYKEWPESEEYPYPVSQDEMDNISIVGNIYENPNLLKKSLDE